MNTFEEIYKKIINESSDEDREVPYYLSSDKSFSIHIELGNAAFGDDPESRDAEIIRILEKVIADIEDGKQLEQDTWPIMDINGNRVGEVTYN